METTLKDIYNLSLSGQEKLEHKEVTMRENLSKDANKKWEHLESAILNSTELVPILDKIVIKKPDDWIGNFQDKYLHEYSLYIDIKGYTKIKTTFIYHTKEDKWIQNKFYETDCLVCEKVRADNLAEMLALAWKHYTHL